MITYIFSLFSAPDVLVETSAIGSEITGETLTIVCFINGTSNLAANFMLTWTDKNGNIVENYTGIDNNITHTFNPKVSDAGPYVCSGIVTSPYLDESTLSINETLNIYLQSKPSF